MRSRRRAADAVARTRPQQLVVALGAAGHTGAARAVRPALAPRSARKTRAARKAGAAGTARWTGRKGADADRPAHRGIFGGGVRHAPDGPASAAAQYRLHHRLPLLARRNLYAPDNARTIPWPAGRPRDEIQVLRNRDCKVTNARSTAAGPVASPAGARPRDSIIVVDTEQPRSLATHRATTLACHPPSNHARLPPRSWRSAGWAGFGWCLWG
jgi:hypothetical protein